MSKLINMKVYLKQLILTLMLALPSITLAQYTTLVDIPDLSGTLTFNSFVNALYVLSISVAALLAVIKIVIAGVKWMVTDVVPNKGEAKKDIQNALLGLLIILAAVLILTVINPNLTGVTTSITPATGSTPVASTPTTPVTYDTYTAVPYPSGSLTAAERDAISALQSSCLSPNLFVREDEQARCYTANP